MDDYLKPKVVISKCLGFAACRYNAQSIHDIFIESLKPYINFITICPEVEIGLGVPRNSIRIITENGQFKLYQPATEKDITEKMSNFTNNFLLKLNKADGFILKYRSPTCGIKGVRVYPNRGKAGAIARTSGFFASEVLKRFPYYPIEDEGRLKNFSIREHFLTKLYIFARFRNLLDSPSMKKLVAFHSWNKLLLMAYSQRELKELGQIVANHKHLPLNEVADLYQTHFFKALNSSPKPNSAINVLTHAFGYFTKELNKEEKSFFLDVLNKYKNKKAPLSVPISIVKSYIARFGNEYLANQTFFNPYPEDLVEITDSGKGRNL